LGGGSATGGAAWAWESVAGHTAGVTSRMYANPLASEATQDDAPQGPSHTAPIDKQWSDAIARGADRPQTNTASNATSKRQRLIARQI
jgi:hypothetical protein